MDKILVLLLINGLYGYTLHGIPTSNTKQSLINVDIDYYTNEPKLVSKTAQINIIKQIRDSDNETTTEPDNLIPVGQWSIVWYVASFGGLIAFFLIVSCSEWCCRRSARTRSSRNHSPSTSAPVTPPPSYDQFGPPTYESLNCGGNCEKSEYDVYVVPVDALGTILSSTNQGDDPPSYTAANDGQLASQSLNLSTHENQSA